MDTRALLPPEHADSLKIGRELFRGRSADGDVVTFVCFDDGFAVRRCGHAVPGCRWGVNHVDEALAAYQELTAFRARRVAAASPPAA